MTVSWEASASDCGYFGYEYLFDVQMRTGGMSKINNEICKINDEMQNLEESRQGEALSVACFFFCLNNYLLGLRHRKYTNR